MENIDAIYGYFYGKYGKYGKYGNMWKGFDQLAWLYLSVEGYVTDLHI
jgi:hypothetical protein